jgi:hypothetical protein
MKYPLEDCRHRMRRRRAVTSITRPAELPRTKIDRIDTM